MLTESTYGFPRPRPFLISEGSPYLDGVLPSTVFDLDATIAASYGGSGTTWSNLVASPADGAAKTDYDFYTGDGATSSTYPTFNGTAGNAAAYWSTDGGDYFNLKSGTNTAFLNGLHKTTGGSDFWLALTFSADSPATSQTFFGTGNTGTTADSVGIRYSSSNTIDFRQRAGTSISIVSSANIIANLSTNILIVSHSHSGNQTRFWINTPVADEKSHVFVSAANNATNRAQIFARGDGAGFMDANTRLYSFAMGNEYLDDNKTAIIIAHLNARHGRTYA